jgi:hypothetical protein
MTTDAPRRAALDTTEILENVLSFLPPHTLFVIQRVSQQWRNIIAASPPIQEKMFLRCRVKSPEVWMLTNPGPRRDLTLPQYANPVYPDRKFRTVSASEVESGVWKKSSGGIEHLFTPVTLSPFLRREYGIISYYIEATNISMWTDVMPTKALAQHSSLKNTYLTDPPSKDCEAYLHYEARTSSSKPLSITGHARMLSDKPLIWGDVIDQSLASDSSVCLDGKKLTVAERIEVLEAERNDKAILSLGKGGCISLSANETKIRPMVLTDAEYLRYRPTENSSS